MTNEDLLNDLKQFIDAKFSQEIAHVVTKDDLKATREDLKSEVDGLRQELRATEQHLTGRFDDVSEQLNEIQNAIGTELQDHERRLTRLEHRAA